MTDSLFYDTMCWMPYVLLLLWAQCAIWYYGWRGSRRFYKVNGSYYVRKKEE